MKKHLILSYLLLMISAFAFSQNIGIGTTNPSRAKLEVHGVAGSGNTSGIFGGDGTGISLQRNWPAIGFNQYRDNTIGTGKFMANGYAAVQFFDPTNGSMAFDMIPSGPANTLTFGARRSLTLLTNGNIGILGPGASTASLVVEKGDNIDGTAIFGGSTHHSYFNYSSAENTYIRAGKNFGTVFINDITGGKISMGGGNSFVGINSTNPAYSLEILQANNKGLLLIEPTHFDNWELRSFTGTGSNSLDLTFNGTIRGFFYSPNGEYFNVSDRRLKSNIQSLSSSLEKLMQLQPVEYEMIPHNPSHKKTIGFIAQDVKKLFPELVIVRTDTLSGYKGINDLHTLDYSGFGVLAIKAIQDQQLQLNNMKKEIDILKEQNKMLMQLSNRKN